MFQNRVPDPTGQNSKGVWVSPTRDLAHCFPYLIRLAIQLASDRITASQGAADEVKEIHQARLGKLAVAVAQYVKLAATDGTVENHKQCMNRSELEAMAKVAGTEFDTALRDVLLQVYFKSIREALHGEKPLGLTELMKFVEER